MNKVSTNNRFCYQIIIISVTILAFLFSDNAKAGSYSEQKLFKAFNSYNIKLLGGNDSVLKMVRIELLLGNISVRAKEKDTNNTFLHYAASLGSVKTTERLINKSAPINAVNIYGYTPLMEAANRGYSKIVKILIQKGANIDLKDNNGKTALNMAQHNDSKEVVKILKDSGAK